MKKYLQLTLASFVAVLSVLLAAQITQPAGAIDVFQKACGNGTTTDSATTPTTGGTDTAPGVGSAAGDSANTSGGPSSLCGASTQDDAQDIIKNVINAILVVLGMAAVIMIIIGGVRYTVSNGDASSVKGAKDTILYAVVGLVIAILSYAIVNFVLGRFS